MAGRDLRRRRDRASVAYFLSRRGVAVIVVERRGVACAASGKAGAFLALDWLAGSRLDALARRSFALHARLPDEIEGDWGYQRLTTYGGFAVPDHDARRRLRARLDWLCRRRGAQPIGWARRRRPRRFTRARSRRR